MTTPESEPDPHAGGESHSWRAQPAVPGWTAGQDWYAGPNYDDTGWQIDLSGVDWGDDGRFGRQTERQPPPEAAFPYEDQEHQEGNGVPAAPADYGRPADDRANRHDGRPGGRHARTSAGDDPLAPRAPGRRSGPARGPVWEEPPPHEGPQRSGREAGDWDDGLGGPVRERPAWDDPDRGRGSRPPGRDSGDGYRPDRRGAEDYEPGGYQPDGPGQPDWQGLQGRPDSQDWPDTQRGPDGLRRPARQRPASQRPAGTRRVSSRPPSGYADGSRPLGTAGTGQGGPGPSGTGLASPAGTYADTTDGHAVRPARPAPTRLQPSRRRRDDTGTMSIVRSSGVMAAGTLASRLTGFLRTLAQAFVLGGIALSNSYNTANTLPNVVYNLALGGILTSVIVPLIVTAAQRDKDGGEAYDQRIFTLITGALLGITVVATLAAAPLAGLYKGAMTGRELSVMVTFAYFFIPQIFFYGMSSLISAILNARRSFAAPMWTPVVNNVVVILVLVLYMAIAGPFASSLQHVSNGEVKLLGLGTTLGIVAQTAALVPSLRRVGFRWRPQFEFLRSEAMEIGQMAGWMFCYIAATQVAFFVTVRLANVAAPKQGVTFYSYAWQLFQMPYAVVGISVITALLPRMSAHATERRYGLVRQDFSTGVRLASAIVVPCSLVLAVLGPRLARVLFAHHSFTAMEARYTGLVFAAFCLGLLPYMMFQLQLRVFYSLHDSKTPAIIGLATMVMNIAANYFALAVLHGVDVVIGLGVGFGLANLLGAVLAWRILSRRLRGLDGWLIGRSLVRMHAATLPAALIAILVGLLSTNAYITVIVGGGLAVLLYLAFARALRIEELTSLTRTVMARLRR